MTYKWGLGWGVKQYLNKTKPVNAESKISGVPGKNKYSHIWICIFTTLNEYSYQICISTCTHKYMY